MGRSLRHPLLASMLFIAFAARVDARTSAGTGGDKGHPAPAQGGAVQEPTSKPHSGSAVPASSTPASAEKGPGASEPAASGPTLTPEEFQRQRAAAQRVLIKGLLELAEWCNSKELFLERDHVYQQVIELDRDNLDAHKGLRYARNPDGSWKEPAKREATNMNKKALEEQLPAKRSEAIAAYRDALLDALERTTPDPALRKATLAEILALDPDDARVHKLLDEVKVEGKWMMPESAAGKKRRAELKAFVKSSLDGAPAPEADAPTDAETALADKWPSAVRSGGVRVLGTAPVEECQRIARTCAAVGPLLQSLFGCKVEYPAEYTLYVFASPQQKNEFVDKLPNQSDANRAFMRSMASVGVSGGNNVVIGDVDAPKRLDGAVRHTLIHLLRAAYGIDVQHGWVWEGLGLYVTRELVGTRFTWFVLASPGADHEKIRGNLLTPSSNWMNEALKLLDGQKPPELSFVVAREVTQMHVEDMLCAYALAAYFVEGHPQETDGLLRLIGGGDSTASAVQGLFGMNMDGLQARLARWLRERK
jgi:hypothetical protein